MQNSHVRLQTRQNSEVHDILDLSNCLNLAICVSMVVKSVHTQTVRLLALRSRIVLSTI